MVLLVFLLLIFSIILPLLGRWLGSALVVNSVNLIMILSSIVTMFLIYEVVLLGCIIELHLKNWVQFLFLRANFSLMLDPMNSLMLFLVVFISTLVFIFSNEYMYAESDKLRFFFYLSLFTFFMAFMVVSSNFLQFFFAWEGVGVTSYLLINYWYTRTEANRSAMKALLVNRFGDFGLYLALILLFSYFKSTDFVILGSLAHELVSTWTFSFFGFPINCYLFFTSLLAVAIVGKSAQLGLHVWLADAMEGPTPVSALLHAATMVTAGVFLFLKLGFLLQLVPCIMCLMAFWGSMTAFFSSVVGVYQNDLKKIIAYSTCSQLGYMVAACGLGGFAFSFYHLCNHAFFKAMLFLGAGVVIHSIINEQDIRRLGGLANFFPFTFLAIMIGMESLIGFPFMSGFFSKENIITSAYLQFSLTGHFCYWLLLFAAFFTSYYSTRVVYLAFFSPPSFSLTYLFRLTENKLSLILPISLLFILSLISGYVLKDLFSGPTICFGSFLVPISYYVNSTELEAVGFFQKLAPVLMMIFGSLMYLFCHWVYTNFFFALLPYKSKLKFLFYFSAFFRFGWYIESIYFKFVHKILELSWSLFFKNIDKGIIEDCLVVLPVCLILRAGSLIKSLVGLNLNVQLSKLMVLTTFILVVFCFLHLKILILLLFFIGYFLFIIY